MRLKKSCYQRYVLYSNWKFTCHIPHVVWCDTYTYSLRVSHMRGNGRNQLKISVPLPLREINWVIPLSTKVVWLDSPFHLKQNYFSSLCRLILKICQTLPCLQKLYRSYHHLNCYLFKSNILIILYWPYISTVPDTASRTSEDECKWQLAPNDLFSWNNNTMNQNSRIDMLHYGCPMHNDTYSVHNHSSKPWWSHLPCP